MALDDETAPSKSARRKVKTELKALAKDEQDFVILFLEKEWFTKGQVPSFDVLVKETQLTRAALIDFLRAPATAEALDRRGIRNPFFNDHYFVKSKGEKLPAVAHVNITTSKDEKKSLTELQFIAVNVMLDFRDNRSQKKKLADYGISTTQWDGWLQDPVFQDYLQTRAEALLNQNQHEAHLALVDRVRSGDLGAIKYFNQMTGRFTEQSNDQFNPQYVIMRVIEIITLRVQDTELQQVIANDLLALANEGRPAAITGSVAS